MKLTDRQIRLTIPPKSGRITLTDGNGLQLRITSMNRRTWSLQYRRGGAMLKWAVGVGYIDRNPAADIPKAAKERPRERVLGLDQVRAIISACDSLARAQGGFVKFLLLSGQRLNEIAKLRWDEVMDDQIVIPRDRNKSGETIITPLLPHLKEIIESCSSGDGQFVFSTTNGMKPILAFSQIKSQLQTASGTCDWTFHDFRRSMATALADGGVEQFAIKCALNHKDNSVTGVYERSFHIKMKSSALIEWQGLIQHQEAPKLAQIRAIK